MDGVLAQRLAVFLLVAKRFSEAAWVAAARELPILSRPFRRFARVPVDLFPNNLFGGFVQIGLESLL